MKKIIICTILSFMWIIPSLADEYVTKSITITRGKTCTLDPVGDIGLPKTYNPGSYVSKQTSVNNINEEGSYDIIAGLDVSVADISIASVFHQTHTQYSSPKGYYTYQVTPLKQGAFIFKQRVTHSYMNSPYATNYVITYNITVVDVIAISMVQTLSMYIGEEKQIIPTIIQVGAETTLTWQSSNPSIASVSSDGMVSAISKGVTTITCTAYNGVSATCEVTVNPVLVSSITLNNTETEMTVGENLQLSATVAPDNATDKGITWSSTNEAVAVVSESGLVTAVGSGTCQVKATANDGSGKTASCLVTVEKNNKLTVTDMTQCSGGRGVLNVLLSDEETVMGFQFDLELPAGVTVPVDNNNKLIAALTGNAVNTHSISSSKVSDGLYRFIVTPQGSRAISNANGDGMTITIDVADNVAVGTYYITIKDIEMTIKKTGNVFEDIHPKNSTAKLTITEATIGDVNGDGRVSVTDVISMNSYILEEEPAQFIRKVADLNGDGKVTITDMVQVIDIILGR